MTMNEFSLKGKVAAITGGTRGIGRSIAIGMAEAGADIALLQRSPDQVSVKQEIEQLGVKCSIVPCDLFDLRQVKEAIPAVVNTFGKIDILVNNAGIQRRSPAVDFSEEDWDDVIQVNLKVVWLLCQQAGKYMVPQKKRKNHQYRFPRIVPRRYSCSGLCFRKGGCGSINKSVS